MIDLESYSINFPGRIVNYYEQDQTADIKICAEKVYNSSSDSNSLEERQLLLRVPVHTPSGGGWAMTMPIKAGDTCILFFSQIGFDHWLYKDKDTGGKLEGEPVPHLLRQLDENDAYALVGLNTIPRAVSDYSMDGSEWRGPDSSKQVIRLKEDTSIEIESAIKVTVIAPAVEVLCNTMTAEVAETLTANVGTISNITCPTVNVTSAIGITCTTPLLSVTGNLQVGGGIGAGGSAPAAGGGLQITGNSNIDGSLETSGNITTPNTIVNGKSVDGHVHSDPEGGDVGPF